VEVTPLLSLLFSDHTNSKRSEQAEKDRTQLLREREKSGRSTTASTDQLGSQQAFRKRSKVLKHEKI